MRDTEPPSYGNRGGGISIVGLDDPRAYKRATLTLRSSLLEKNRGYAVLVQSSDATIESIVVRDTRPGSDGLDGMGIVVQAEGGMFEDTPTAHERSTLTLRTSLLEQNHSHGVLVLGSDATIESTILRDTLPEESDGRFGRGIGVEWNATTHKRAKLTLRSSLVQHSHDAGVFVLASDATIEGTVVRDTQPHRDGKFGDGIAMESDDHPNTVTVTSCVVQSNARAGISNFSGSITLASSVVQCNRIDLNGEDDEGGPPFTFDCNNRNLFGCEIPDPTCSVLSAGLTPPDPIPPIRPSP
ncbi:hypothetical protein BE17_47960 [Sorangium cellulosum]|uniref:Right handed beta helix domain-containing protein n=1 Tax=Sorangium cellulosum TaxID=56 RepID=A0A150QY97_SORCE|nr:hypothetical protein BE17_47960 [Sorangium cellulosum]